MSEPSFQPFHDTERAGIREFHYMDPTWRPGKKTKKWLIGYEVRLPRNEMHEFNTLSGWLKESGFGPPKGMEHQIEWSPRRTWSIRFASYRDAFATLLRFGGGVST